MKKLVALLFLLVAAGASAQTINSTIGAQASSCSTSGASGTAAGCVILQLNSTSGSASITVSGTFVATLQFEVSGDAQANWAGISCYPPSSTSGASSTTATGFWQCNVAGFTHLRVRSSAYTSGTATINLQANPVSARAVGAGGGGALVLLEQHTASNSATLDFTACLSGTYNEYILRFEGLLPVTNAVNLGVQFSTNGGTSWDTSNYAAGNRFSYAYSGGVGVSGTTSTTYAIMLDSWSNDATKSGVNGTLHINNVNSANQKTYYGQTISYHSSNLTYSMGFPLGGFTTTSAINALRVLASSGNISAGTVKCYGVA